MSLTMTNQFYYLMGTCLFKQRNLNSNDIWYFRIILWYHWLSRVLLPLWLTWLWNDQWLKGQLGAVVHVWLVIIRCLLDVSLNPIKSSHCYLDQETLPSSISTGLSQEQIQQNRIASFTIKLKSISVNLLSGL